MIRSLVRLVAMIAAGAIGAAGAAQSPCGPGAGLCNEPHGGLGCVMTECCRIVCDANPLCCEIGWDTGCVDLAATLCVGIACPSPGSCTEAHGNAGCVDEECCNFVCRIDPWCCSRVWDEACAIEAARLCPTPTCTIDIPAGVRSEEEPCYRRLNDGCNMPVDQAFPPIACGETILGKWTTGAPRDTDWWKVSVTESATRRIRVHAEFPSETLVLTGPCDGPLELHATLHGSPCGEVEAELLLTPGDWYVVVSGATEARPFRRGFPCDEINPDLPPPGPDDPPFVPGPYGLRYLVTVECPGPVADLDGDGRVGSSDLTILLAAWGQSGPGDLNGDGTVGSADLTILLGAWTP